MAANVARKAPGRDSLCLRLKTAAGDDDSPNSSLHEILHPIPLGPPRAPARRLDKVPRTGTSARVGVQSKIPAGKGREEGRIGSRCWRGGWTNPPRGRRMGGQAIGRIRTFLGKGAPQERASLFSRAAKNRVGRC